MQHSTGTPKFFHMILVAQMPLNNNDYATTIVVVTAVEFYGNVGNSSCSNPVPPLYVIAVAVSNFVYFNSILIATNMIM